MNIIWQAVCKIIHFIVKEMKLMEEFIVWETKLMEEEGERGWLK